MFAVQFSQEGVGPWSAGRGPAAHKPSLPRPRSAQGLRGQAGVSAEQMQVQVTECRPCGPAGAESIGKGQGREGGQEKQPRPRGEARATPSSPSDTPEP